MALTWYELQHTGVQHSPAWAALLAWQGTERHSLAGQGSNSGGFRRGEDGEGSSRVKMRIRVRVGVGVREE